MTLWNAADRGIKDINVTCPLFIDQIKSENHKETLQMFDYTLESEKQHRDYLEGIVTC
jgi:hypothetical protein